MHPATELIRRTGELFESISLINGGVSIREAIVIDNYGSMAERKEARSKDELTDWGRLVGTDDLKRHVDAGALCFVDARGLRFYLPPCLSSILSLDNPDDCPELIHAVLFHLSDAKMPLQLLNQPQTLLVRDILLHLEQKTDRSTGLRFEAALRAVTRRLNGQH